MVYTGLLLIIHTVINSNIRPRKAIYKHIINIYLCTPKDYKTTFYNILPRNRQVNRTNKPDTKDLLMYVYKLCLRQLV